MILFSAFINYHIPREIKATVVTLQAAALSLVDKGLVDRNAVVAFGISHGGFLSTQLVVQYPVSFIITMYL